MAKKTEFKWNKTERQVVRDLGFSPQAELMLAETSARYMNKYVPFKDGFLSQNYETGVDAVSGFVKYNQPYAHYQYNGIGFNFTTDYHPLATHHWDKQMMISDRIPLTIEADIIRKRFAR